MTTNQPTLSATQVRCGACGHGNNDSAQFCAGCGQALFEPCPSCNQSVRLEQRFCGGCGTNLQERRDKLREQFEGWMVSSVAAAKACQFEQALSLLERIASNNDYRFAELCTQAKAALEKVTKLRAQRVATVDSLISQAQAAFTDDNKPLVVELLSKIPEPMHTNETKSMLEGCASFVQQVTSLETSLQKLLSAKDYEAVAGVVGALIELVPRNDTYRKLAKQVTEKLLSSSRRRFDKQNYAAAAAKLSAVPALMRDERYEQARQLIENVEWLERQVDAEPFASATLGRLAVRFEKESPENPRAKQTTQELLAAIKKPLEEPRNPFNSWRGGQLSWLGGKVNYLGYPRSIQLGDDENLRRMPGRFHIAIGLALQGLGLAKIEEAFANKRGRLAGLMSKKVKSCWGIDVGSGAMRAVLLQIEGDNVVVKESFVQEFEIPLTRIGSESNSLEQVRSALTAFKEKHPPEKESPVWVNIPAGDVVSKFVRLPPVKDKQADEMLALEAKQRIPIAMDTLEVVQWIGDLVTDSIHGRPAMVCAAKKTAVIARTDLFGQAGIKIAGMQCDQVALANFVYREFADSLDGDEDEASGALPTVAIVDSGASYTTLLLIHRESFWFWTMECGGEDLTASIARATHLVHREAEELKRFPAKMPQPRDAFEHAENKMDEWQSRLKKLLTEGGQQNGRIDVKTTWCCGGAPLTHSWIRRVLLDS